MKKKSGQSERSSLVNAHVSIDDSSLSVTITAQRQRFCFNPWALATRSVTRWLSPRPHDRHEIMIIQCPALFRTVRLRRARASYIVTHHAIMLSIVVSASCRRCYSLCMIAASSLAGGPAIRNLLEKWPFAIGAEKRGPFARPFSESFMAPLARCYARSAGRAGDHAAEISTDLTCST